MNTYLLRVIYRACTRIPLYQSVLVGWMESLQLRTYFFITNSFLMILLSSSNSSTKQRVLKFLALFYIFLFYDLPFVHVCNLEENLLCSTLILGSVYYCVIYYGNSLIVSRKLYALYQMFMLPMTLGDL